MGKVKVGVAGYGVIGQRLADGVALQQDMELVGIADVAVTLPIRALREKGMPYKLFSAVPEKSDDLKNAGVPISGMFEDLLKEVDVMLDSSGYWGEEQRTIQKAWCKGDFSRRGEE